MYQPALKYFTEFTLLSLYSPGRGLVSNLILYVTAVPTHGQ